MESLEATLEAVASRFEERIGDVAAVVAARSRDEVADMRAIDSEELWESVREITRSARQQQADHLRRGRELPTACLPCDATAAWLSSRGGVSLHGSLQSYRIGHAVAWDAWLDAIDSLELDPASWRLCVRVLSRFVDAYDDRVMELFAEEYLRASEEQRRGGLNDVAMLRDLLEGARDEAPELNYPLDGDHIAFVASGRGPQGVMRRLAAELSCELLMAELSGELVWGWLGRRTPFGDARGALNGFTPNGAGPICFGDADGGLGGFRRSHRQAGDAYVVARRRRAPVTFYGDVALEAMALRDELVARDFAEVELRKLGDDVKLRDTVRRYFACSQNAASTAAALDVHEHTVARRLRTAEERLGCPLNDRRAELELALRIDELLG